jgi:hypothetical protein
MPYADTYTRNDSLRSPTADHRQDAYFTPDRSYPQDYQSVPRMPRKPAVNDYYGGSGVGGSPTKLMTRDQDRLRDYHGVRNNSTSPSPPHRRPQLITTINISHKLTIIIEIEKSQISNQEIGLMMVSIQGNLMHGYYEIYH